MLVTLCVIAYNEEQFLEGLLDDIRNQTYDHNNIELVFVNNGSQDKTGDIMEKFSAENKDFFSIKIVEHKKSNQATGWNTAFLHTRGNIIIKVDAHSKIPADFVENNVKVIMSGEYVCGGGRPNITLHNNHWGNTLLTAEENLFGGNFVKYRKVQKKKEYINSIFNGAYRRDVFANVGGFNEALGRTEDNEFHYRVTKAGYRICCSPDIVSYQYIRSNLRKMAFQKYANGFWIGLTFKTFPECLSRFYFVPFLFVLSLLICMVLAFLGQPLLLYLLLLCYGCFDLFLTFNSWQKKSRCLHYLLLPLIFPLLHIAFGVGTLIGLCHKSIKKEKLHKAKRRIRQVKMYYMGN